MQGTAGNSAAVALDAEQSFLFQSQNPTNASSSETYSNHHHNNSCGSSNGFVEGASYTEQQFFMSIGSSSKATSPTSALLPIGYVGVVSTSTSVANDDASVVLTPTAPSHRHSGDAAIEEAHSADVRCVPGLIPFTNVNLAIPSQTTTYRSDQYGGGGAGGCDNSRQLPAKAAPSSHGGDWSHEQQHQHGVPMLLCDDGLEVLRRIDERRHQRAPFSASEAATNRRSASAAAHFAAMHSDDAEADATLTSASLSGQEVIEAAGGREAFMDRVAELYTAVAHIDDGAAMGDRTSSLPH